MNTPNNIGAICNQFDVSLIMPLSQPNTYHMVAESLPVVESDLTGLGTIGLIGRDVLLKCALTYSGPSGIYILSI